MNHICHYVLHGSVSLFFLLVAADCFCTGLAKLNEARATESKDLIVANRAVSLAPLDPEAYRTRSAVLLHNGQLHEAIRDAERAVQLNPRDYLVWEDLGNILHQQKDLNGALNAYRAATFLAPKYPDVRWKFGLSLLEMGRTREAFVEFRRASTDNSALFLNAAELAWTASDGDCKFVLEALDPRTNKERIALSGFFFRYGKRQEANTVLRGIDLVSEQDRLSLVAELIVAEQFDDAQMIWLMGGHNEIRNTHGQVTDGGFEDAVITDEAGFGWQFQQHEKTVTAALDKQNHANGAQSLRLDWKGQSDPATPLVAQLVVVNPESRYELKFAARADQLVTGGLPVIEVMRATGNVTQSATTGDWLAHSQPIDGLANSWQQFTVNFETGEAQAIYIVIRRATCAEKLCPIFGSAWFDDFHLTELSKRS